MSADNQSLPPLPDATQRRRLEAKNYHIEAWKAQTEYACEYLHNGQKWAVNFFAIDGADANEKAESIKQSLVILGPIELTIFCDEKEENHD
ncbi:MAG: hypothetical protein JJD98_00035 [Polaromonas sp.]|nr:hypothetical protein [Polaromonas sp.]